MIFICTGTQIYQFNRLLREIDLLIEKGIIGKDVFAQIGSSNYHPKHYDFCNFISADVFKEYQAKADLIISHGGSGALIGGLKIGKNIIAVPRLAAFGEHVDDHQLQIVKVLEDEGYLRAVYDINDLGKVILQSLREPITKKYDRESNVLKIVECYIASH